MTRSPKPAAAPSLPPDAAPEAPPRPNPHLREAEALEREAAALRGTEARRLAHAAARLEEQRAAHAVCQTAEEQHFRPAADAILAELRAALPGSATWAPRLRQALADYERETEATRREFRAIEGVRRGEFVLARHPLSRLRPLIEWLSDAAGSGG